MLFDSLAVRVGIGILLALLILLQWGLDRSIARNPFGHLFVREKLRFRPYTVASLHQLLLARRGDHHKNHRSPVTSDDMPLLLRDVLKNRRNDKCPLLRLHAEEASQNGNNTKTAIKQNSVSFGPGEITYLALARSGSTTLFEVLGKKHHEPNCRLRDLEALGARRVVIPLRHPMARIASGLSSVLRGKGDKRSATVVQLRTTFTEISEQTGDSPEEAYLKAIRDDTDNRVHQIARKAITTGSQPHKLPVYEYYLESLNPELHFISRSEIRFLCMDTLVDDLERALQAWDGVESRKRRAHSPYARANWTQVMSRFSKESIKWVERVYKHDVELYRTFCPRGYRSFTRALRRARVH